MRMFFFIPLLSLLAACQEFPPHGTGGFAEHQRYTHTNAYPSSFHHYSSNSRQQRWQRDNLQSINCIDHRLAELRQQGINEHYPAQLWLIEQQRNRTLRLFAGGLGWDGEREVQKLYRMMEKLQARLIKQEKIELDLNQHQEKIQCNI
ncbi:MAG: hypothetical protein P8P30_01355 [Rickettsiales bacterium]|nr:hypothetical protein [Rickettsiales bacterium]